MVVNYHEIYHARQQDLYNKIKQTLQQEHALQDKDLNNLCLALMRNINRQELVDSALYFDCAINLKPTVVSAPVIDYIEQYLLQGCGLSEYFRNMFLSYTMLTSEEREKIVFADVYQKLCTAIEHRKSVFITMKDFVKVTNQRFECSPYCLAPSKEELHYYVLSASRGKIYSLRLSRIESVRELLTDATFTQKQEQVFARMLKYGPQYPYANNETEIKVEFTAVGVDKFKRMYIHRPIPNRVEGNCYYFNCSYHQAEHYFVRFGKEAYVVYPLELREKILQFHSMAKKRYYQERYRSVARARNFGL